MTQELTTTRTNNLSIWDSDDQVKTIKEIYGKNLTQCEFNTLIQIGKATHLNPFLRELWAVKYGDNPAQIFVGRDGYRKSSQANPDYDYHHVEAVYSNDTLHYDLKNGEVNHTTNLKDRGTLFGAYCIVKRKSSSKPIYVFVEFKEYSTSKSLWASKPATMIKKVAEAQCLRMAFQDILAGTYAEEEIHNHEEATKEAKQFIDAEVVKDVPVSQSFRADEDILKSCLHAINTSKDMNELKIMYATAMIECKGDRDAINAIAEAKNARKKELQTPIQPIQTTEEFLQELGA